MAFYCRNLPHWFPDEKAIFITWRLRGSLPRLKVPAAAKRAGTSPGKEFRRQDAMLDRGSAGPLWLKNPQIAALVVSVLQRGSTELGRYGLHAYVVMANHVHVLLTPKVEVQEITKSLKGITAHQANQILHRTGKPFWQDESFDRWVRSEAEFGRIRRYIERNPVTAGLVEKPENWQWSSAYQKQE
jgi:REP element-mobilizing transposase RayT